MRILGTVPLIALAVAGLTAGADSCGKAKAVRATAFGCDAPRVRRRTPPAIRAVAQAVAEALSPFEAALSTPVLVGQAFHWFDFEPALAEIHRVLPPGGGLGMIWNMRDERHDWVTGLGDIRRRHRDIRSDSGAWRRPVESSELFGPLVEQRFAYQHVLAPDGVVELMACRSFIAAVPMEENRAVREEIAQLLASHAQTRGERRRVVPCRTDVYWITTR